MMKTKKKLTLLAFCCGMLLSLTACKSNKIDDTWVKYDESTELDKTTWKIDAKANMLAITEYENGEQEETELLSLYIDKEKGLLTQVTNDGDREAYPFTVDKDTLTIGEKTFYREGSKIEKENVTEIKKTREKNEKERKKRDKEEKEKEEKLKIEEQAYNKAIEALEERINAEFIKKYEGDWYSEDGFNRDNTNQYQTASATKITVKDNKIASQSSEVSIGDERDIRKEEILEGNFIGITLLRKYEYNDYEQPENVPTNIDLPDSIEGIEKIETLADFADYLLKNNVETLSFSSQTTKYKGKSPVLILNLYNLEELHTFNTDQAFLKQLSYGFKETDFDI
ncbi:hypothetical protein [Vagococcus xieshaowenii]|uniref:DUF5067 domain-containing protein n=1 Tax=Vagococcus xieshaowenii TaxID=2562451 RepID=A0AAJ5JM59_9ENTE|nr:hypothetical protein [Vagococcus xieshaowenii]QCA29476.1 hypothetical protein E4Z98_09150 [Vagococcus xieshaowenii]TFZ42592.1 hypothetical protein E4031_02550 [Vagococcus xieshaowenii]